MCRFFHPVHKITGEVITFFVADGLFFSTKNIIFYAFRRNMWVFFLLINVQGILWISDLNRQTIDISCKYLLLLSGCTRLHCNEQLYSTWLCGTHCSVAWTHFFLTVFFLPEAMDHTGLYMYTTDWNWAIKRKFIAWA